VTAVKVNKKNITTKSKSTILKLKNQNKLTDQLLTAFNQLTLEEVIAIKFELAANHLNNRLYGFDIWHKSNFIIKEAILKFAISSTNSKKDASRFLGLTYGEFLRILKKYKVNEYFDENL
jgi:methionyl-tRNA formyltransferase